MDESDRKIILVIIALWIVQSVFAVGSLRTELETMLILGLVPPFDLIIEVFTLLGESDVGSIMFYLKFFTILIKDVLIVTVLNNWKKRRDK
jgi:hypothetical protein